MRGTLELTPDQLAQLVEAVMAVNGIKVSGLSLYLSVKDPETGVVTRQLVGYDSVVIHHEVSGGINVYDKPPQTQLTKEQLERFLNPTQTDAYGNPRQFSSRVS